MEHAQHDGRCARAHLGQLTAHDVAAGGWMDIAQYREHGFQQQPPTAEEDDRQREGKPHRARS